MFSGCISIEKITLPTAVLSIGDMAFSGCSGLKEIKMSANLRYINRYAFEGCTQLSSTVLPASLLRIDIYAFRNCENLNSVIFENIKGWAVYSDSDTFDGTAVSEDNMSNPAVMAQALKGEYLNLILKRATAE